MLIGDIMKDWITIDGSQGEGGGQVLRTSLTLSAVTGHPVRIEKIRAGREKPGLKRQHLTCVKAVAEICGAKVSAVEGGSGELEFVPGSMGTASYIVRGLGNPDSFESCSHGAGRRMSRVAASSTLTVEECDKAMDGIVCERWHKYTGFSRKAKGKFDLSEAPQAYKDIETVIDAERDLVEPLVRLVPLASLKG